MVEAAGVEPEEFSTPKSVPQRLFARAVVRI